jgi:hypothetical protein
MTSILQGCSQSEANRDRFGTRAISFTGEYAGQDGNCVTWRREYVPTVANSASL